MDNDLEQWQYRNWVRWNTDAMVVLICEPNAGVICHVYVFYGIV